MAGVAVGACAVLAGVGLFAVLSDDDERRESRSPTQNLVASPKAAGAFPRAYSGTWRGALATDEKGWEVQLALPGGADTGSVQYYQNGEIQCTGTVRYVKAGKHELRLDEQTPNCTPNKSGIVRLTAIAKGLRHQWYADQDDLAENAPSYDGTLKKVG
ncbi:hypothetical protein EDD29_9050 [Actinocorallia herbida]|uniref:Serine/threonine protein kinase n=1 Tax=Actinocorallia herbida TaxID=58109 RepID=A0A3N1DCP6_9ACTN|nr:hypothetical protein [Actinocorallia herbida]ROO91297.1 hypothetical protein EDD29_9050 [Actinocorallia herbida]